MGDGLLDFGRAPIVKGRAPSIAMPMIERVRAAQGMKQAVVKVASYAHGIARVQGVMDYISRKGKLELETESGERITDRQEAKALAANWSGDFDRGRRSRDAVHVVFSMPAGSKVEALRESVRKVGARAFPDQEWVFAIHQDKQHPHAHMVIKMRGRKKDKKLRLGKPQLYKLREIFAEAAREEGVPLAASSRAARGIGRKGESQAIYQMHHKGIVPKVEKQAAEELIFDLERGPLMEKPWEKAMRERNERERKAYREEAARLRAAAIKARADQDHRLQHGLLKTAGDLERFAEDMPEAKSKRQAMLEKVGIKMPKISKSRQADHEIGD